MSKRSSLVSFVLLVAVAACGSGSPQAVGGADDAGAASAPDAANDASSPYDGGAGPATVRVLAGNLSTGSNQSYDPGEGIRILRGLKPDVALLQELNYGANGDADVRTLVDAAFGASFSYYRESGAQIPNAVVSRWPILESGAWPDPQVQNRKLVYAKVQIPGAHPLWAVSLHLLTTGASERDLEAQAVVAQVKSVVAAGDYVIVGGDFNTDVRTEPCIATFGAIVATPATYPDDGHGNSNTSGTRTKPHDWVLPNAFLAALEVPTMVGANSYPTGLVFDSRVYTPLADVAPVLATDCAAANMQHMAVVEDFRIE